MSKLMTFGTLGVLVVLLGVLKYSVSKATDPPPPPNPETIKQSATNRAAAERDKQGAMIKAQEQVAERMREIKKRGGKMTPAPSGPDISDHWYRNYSDGSKGIQDARKQPKQQFVAAPTFTAPPKPVAIPANLPYPPKL